VTLIHLHIRQIKYITLDVTKSYITIIRLRKFGSSIRLSENVRNLGPSLLIKLAFQKSANTASISYASSTRVLLPTSLKKPLYNCPMHLLPVVYSSAQGRRHHRHWGGEGHAPPPLPNVSVLTVLTLPPSNTLTPPASNSWRRPCIWDSVLFSLPLILTALHARLQSVLHSSTRLSYTPSGGYTFFCSSRPVSQQVGSHHPILPALLAFLLPSHYLKSRLHDLVWLLTTSVLSVTRPDQKDKPPPHDFLRNVTSSETHQTHVTFSGTHQTHVT